MNNLKSYTRFVNENASAGICYLANPDGIVVAYNLVNDRDALYEFDALDARGCTKPGWIRGGQFDFNNPKYPRIQFSSLEEAQVWFTAYIAFFKKPTIQIPDSPLTTALKKLAKFIDADYDHVNNGNCFWFATILRNYFSIDSFLAVYDVDGEEDAPIHILAKIGKLYYDGLGFHTKSDVLSSYDMTSQQWRGYTSSFSGSEIEVLYNTYGESDGLSIELFSTDEKKGIVSYVKEILDKKTF